MASYQDPGVDPYAAYEPELDLPYGIDDPIEIYDEGTDSYGDDSVYISDDFQGVEFDGGYDYEYDEMYEGEGEGEEIWDEDFIYADGDWLPLLPEEIPLETLPIGDRPEDYGSQLLIGGLEHPDPALMRDSYCQFYPEACAEGAGLNGRESYNRTEVAEELDRTLKDIDMTGLAIAAVLLLILLFGLHYGGASDTDAAAEEPTPRPSKPKSEAEKKYDGKLKEGGYTDDAERAKVLKDIMAKKTEPEREDKLKRLIAAKKPGGEDPDKKKYKDRLAAAGITEPALSKNVKVILKEEKGEKRSKKAKEIMDAHKAATPGVAADPNMAGYKKRLEDAGYSGDDLKTRLENIAKIKTDEKKEAEVKRLEEKKKKEAAAATATAAAAGGTPAGDAKKPYTEAELDAKLKEMGYTDDTDRKKKVDSLAKRSRATQDTELEKLKKAKIASNAKKAKEGELDKQLQAAGMKSKTDRAAKVAELLPKSGAEQASEIQKIKDANKAGATPGGAAETPEARTKRKADEATAKAAEKEKKAKEAREAKAKKDKETREKLDGELKAAGYTDEKDRKTKVDALMKLKEGPERDTKLAEYKGRKKGSSGVPTADPAAPSKKKDDGKGAAVVPPTGSTVPPPLDEAAIKKKLLDKGYKDPGAIKNITDSVMAKNPEERQKELDKYTAVPRPDRKVLEATAAKAQKKKDSATPPKDTTAVPPVGTTDPPAGSTDPSAGGSSAKPKTEEELRKSLKARRYSDPAIEAMVKAHKAADDAGKLALEKKFRDPKQIKANEAEYNPTGASPPGTKNDDTASSPEIKTAGDLDKALKTAGYSEPARKKMVDLWEKEKDDKKRKNMAASWLKPENLSKYEDRYKGSGGTTPPADAPSTDEEAKLRADLKGNKAKYDPETIDNMVKKWKETPKDKRKNLEKKLKSERSADIADNKKAYAKKGSDPAGPAAGTPEHRAKMDQRLKDQGYDDKDARDEILDEIIKGGGTAKEQEANLEKKYAGRSEATRKSENKKKGDERRAKKNGDTAYKLPSDDEILDKLKAAGWTDPDARQYLLKQIKAADSDAAKKKALESYTKAGRGTPEDNKKYGDRWRKDHPATRLSAADQAIDDQLKKKKYSPEARQNMIKELNAEKDPKKRKDKLDKWLAADTKAVEATNKLKGKSAKRPSGSEDPSRGSGKGKTPSGGAGAGDGGDPWLTGPQIALLCLLLIPLMIVLSRGDVSMPTGESFVRFPSMPGMAAMKGPWASPVVVGGVPVSTGLPDLTSQRSVRKRSSSSSSTPRLAVRPSKAGSGSPSININNVNAQGSDIPINIDSSTSSGGEVVGEVVEEVVVTETLETTIPGEPVTVVEEAVMAEAVVGEAVVQEGAPIEVVEDGSIIIELQGPSDPNRLFWMLISLLVISFPLLLDYIADWPIRTSSDTEYLSAMMHWLILTIGIVFLFLKLDRAYSWSMRYGRPIVHYTRRLPQYVTPMVVGTVEGTEAFIWGVDDALFGSSQELLGLALAAGAFCMIAMTTPYDGTTRGEYSEGAGQFMPVVGAMIVTLLFFNAWVGLG